MLTNNNCLLRTLRDILKTNLLGQAKIPSFYGTDTASGSISWNFLVSFIELCTVPYAST